MIEDYKDVLHSQTAIPTERLLLRKFTMEDAEDVYEYASDAQTVKYLTWEGMSTLEQAKNIIGSFYSNDGVYALELRETGHCAGAISISVIPEHEKAGFGYVLNKKYWGQGYMTEALSAILRLAFDKLELNRVEATHYAGNEGSGKVMEKCGMIKEGFALQEVKVKGIFQDVIHYGITKEQWKKPKNTFI
jgi:ribosomal-protein-alanine N-acetyltransferase